MNGGYLMIDLKQMSLSLESQTVPGLYNSLLEALASNKAVLLYNNGGTPITCHVQKSGSVINIFFDVDQYTVSSDDLVTHKKQDAAVPRMSDLFDTLSISTPYTVTIGGDSKTLSNTEKHKVTEFMDNTGTSLPKLLVRGVKRSDGSDIKNVFGYVYTNTGDGTERFVGPGFELVFDKEAGTLAAVASPETETETETEP